jgi:hypothetical protein
MRMLLPITGKGNDEAFVNEKILRYFDFPKKNRGGSLAKVDKKCKKPYILK